MKKFIHSLPLDMLIISSLLLGLAPFNPPHLFEKIGMLLDGVLVKPIDIFDLLMHGTPVILLILKFTIPKPAND